MPFALFVKEDVLHMACISNINKQALITVTMPYGVLLLSGESSPGG
jgi:hypothetical protein